MRPDGRKPEQMRPVEIIRQFTCHAEGSVLISVGRTRVLCTASVAEGVPRFLKGKGQGWLTAEYGMLPRATGSRSDREAARGKQGGRTVEIQRLIGRSLRGALALDQLGEFTITLDCDVLQADGGTRTASITGAWVALVDALRFMQREKWISSDPLIRQIAAVSVGQVDGISVLDLNYREDSGADTDMNVIMVDPGGFMEIQGTAEAAPFSESGLQEMLQLARSGCEQLFAQQTRALDQ